jgi:hypothetical protein
LVTAKPDWTSHLAEHLFRVQEPKHEEAILSSMVNARYTSLHLCQTQFGIGVMKRTVRLSVALLLVCFPCVPQFETRSVSGLVTDKRGNALPGSVVQLENTATLSIRSNITDKDGRYHFSLLRDDIDYRLKAKYRKHWSRLKTLSKFNSSKHPEVDLVIPID